MTNFASIKFIRAYENVVYYSIVIDGDEHEKSIFELFVEEFTDKEKKKLNHILSWLKEIGTKYGAQLDFFRDERHAVAIPPYGKNRKPCFIMDNTASPNPMRLYCHRLNSKVVLLFNGGIKTTVKAQDCPNVGRPFNLANRLALAIDTALRTNEIEWSEDQDDILFEEDYKLYF